MTGDDLQRLIEEAHANRPDFEPGTITTSEYAEIAGIHYQTARRRLKELVKDGYMEPDPSVIRRDIHGTIRRRPGYKLINRSP